MSDLTPANEPIPGLDDLAAADLPAPTARFADDLDARLRVLHASRPTGAGFVPRRNPRRRVFALGVVAVVGVVLLALIFASGGPTTVELLDARDVVITLPDDTEIEAEPGLRLPPGTTIVTGPAGFAEFDFGRVGPAVTVRVFEDRFETVDDGTDADTDGGAVDRDEDAEPSRRRPDGDDGSAADRPATTTTAIARGANTDQGVSRQVSPTPITPPRRAAPPPTTRPSRPEPAPSTTEAVPARPHR